jgi:hypothetical protein
MSEANEINFDENHCVLPDQSNEIRFHGTLEEFKKYMPELYKKLISDNPKREDI